MEQFSSAFPWLLGVVSLALIIWVMDKWADKNLSKVEFNSGNEISASGNLSVRLFTTEKIENIEIEESLGLISAFGQSWFWTGKNRISEAEAIAVSSLKAKAKRMGADSVVGVKFSAASVKGIFGITFWSTSAVIHISGTAVKTKAKKF